MKIITPGLLPSAIIAARVAAGHSGDRIYARPTEKAAATLQASSRVIYPVAADSIMPISSEIDEVSRRDHRRFTRHEAALHRVAEQRKCRNSAVGTDGFRPISSRMCATESPPWCSAKSRWRSNADQTQYRKPPSFFFCAVMIRLTSAGRGVPRRTGDTHGKMVASRTQWNAPAMKAIADDYEDDELAQLKPRIPGQVCGIDGFTMSLTASPC